MKLPKGLIDDALLFIDEHKDDLRFSKKFDAEKRVLCKKHSVKKLFSDIELLSNLDDEQFQKYKSILQIKPVRTQSGVAVVAVMSKPGKCPHGKCTFCPGGLDSTYGDVPQSYTGYEPATMRGKRANYDSYIQVFNRLEQYVITGHNPEKVELIIMGGTFQNFPKDYQDDFIKGIFKAMNDFSKLFFINDSDFNTDFNNKNYFDFLKFKEFFELPGELRDKNRTKIIYDKIRKEKIINWDSTSITEEQEYNDFNSRIKCIGLTFETRPDTATLEEANQMLAYGCTRIELGIQTVYDDALLRVHRGHTVAQNKKAIYSLRNLGFKLNFHIMPGLPGVSKEKDLEVFKTLFSNESYHPDMLKIYPCMVMPGTALYKDYEQGKFKPITTDEAADLIAEAKKFIPRYTRIMRVQRDIPTKVTTAGVNVTNLRQLVDKKLVEKSINCNCIRCREIRSSKITSPKLNIINYDVLNGEEYFISFDDEASDSLIGFVRLSFPALQLRKEITKDTAIIRELHVYGSATRIGKKGKGVEVQHKGFGTKLLNEAEKIAKEHGKNKLLVISGVGVRGYYRKLGYELEGVYMSKKL